MSHRRRGFALISTFMFLGMLFMMAVSMILMSRQRIFAGMSQHHQTQALYLAEAGLAKAQVALENDLGWPGVTDATIDGMRGTYTVTFGTGKYDSVKNINGITPKPSYRGPDTVPKDYALLIVTANVSGHRYVLEALVKGTGGTGYMSDAILGSGRIVTKGDLSVDGITALDDASPVDGSIQSVKPGTDSDLVTWNGPGTALITGNVGSQGTSGTAISMSGATILGDVEVNSTALMPNYDISSTVSSESSGATNASSLVSSGGTTELDSAKFKLGTTTIPGDLVLKGGATLYVSGDLEVQGSITGNGEIWVTGKTTFKGDSLISTSSEQSVALYSKGSVLLTGFNGTEFLENASGGDAALQKYLVDSSAAIQELQTLVGKYPNEPPNPALATEVADYNRLTELESALGHHQGLSGDLPNEGTVWKGNVNGTNYTNLIGEMREKVEDLPSGTTQEFMYKHIEELEQLFWSPDDILTTGTEDIVVTTAKPSEFWAEKRFNEGRPIGFFDTGLSQGGSTWRHAVNLVNQINHNKLGTSYFQGAIYTQGTLVANNEVQVLGAIMVDGKGTTPENVDLFDINNNKTTLTLEPGDIYLGKRTRVTYVEEMFKDEGTSTGGPQLLVKNLWMGR